MQMKLKKLWDVVEEKVFPVRSTELLFNQWNDEDPEYDIEGASAIRRSNLKNYISCFDKSPNAIVIGEAPGPWGCRFSGAPFTSEMLLQSGKLPFNGLPTSKFDKRVSEISGTIFWKEMLEYHPNFFVWNCIPYHPHKKAKSLSVRTPTKKEIKDHSELLAEVLGALGPSLVVAIGRSAETSLNSLGIKCTYVRHPSQGGAGEFVEGMRAIFAR